jgi:hypothetical protein
MPWGTGAVTLGTLASIMDRLVRKGRATHKHGLVTDHQDTSHTPTAHLITIPSAVTRHISGTEPKPHAIITTEKQP